MYPCARTFAPSRGLIGICAAFVANRAQGSCPTLSRRVKYTCPAGELRACTTSPSIQRSLNSSPDWMCAARRVTTWPTRRIRLGALDVLTGPRVDLDLVPAPDEKRHVDAEAGLHRRWLRRARRGVALEPEVGIGDRHHDRGGHLDADRRALVLAQDHGHAVGQVIGRVAEEVLVERELIVGGRVHEVV